MPIDINRLIVRMLPGRLTAAVRHRRQLRRQVSCLESSGVVGSLARDIEQWAPFVRFAPPGHFYSPIPRLDELIDDAARIWNLPETIPGIDLRLDEQRALVQELAEVLAGDELPPAPSPERRYFSDNVAFGIGDGTILEAMLRRFGPRNIVEIGSGYSSALILDTVERHLPHTKVTLVEPYPDLVRSLMRSGDEERCTILETRAQDLPVEVITQLGRGDLLFIDSTHVVKTGSDVCRIVLDLLPAVAPGVLVHIHDMFWPFELPRGWVEEGRQWSECYLVRAFLTQNPSWEIVLFNDYIGRYEHELLRGTLPQVLHNPGGSLWIRHSFESRGGAPDNHDREPEGEAVPA